jgi:hypothetical protein
MRARLPMIAALALLALSSAFLHSRIHPPSAGNTGLNFPNTVAFVLCLADLFAVTLLFAFRRTVSLAAMLNGIIAIYGSVLMAHHGLALGSIWYHVPHIASAAADLLLGVALLQITMISTGKRTPPDGGV